MPHNSHNIGDIPPETIPDDYPVEYREWSVIFFGKRFLVSKDTLIPRLETESLVRRARVILRGASYARAIDIGTGTGIIPMSLADLVPEIILVDLVPETLAVARENARLLLPGDYPYTCLESDLLKNIPAFYFEAPVLITANLPYIRENDWGNMSQDTRYEPKTALFGGEETGFELYEQFFHELSRIVHHESMTILIEFGYDQRDIAEHILKTYSWEVSFFPDHAGIERFAEIHIPSKKRQE